MRLAGGILALAALGGVDLGLDDRRRRCACCRMPSNRCPCRHCGACSTSGSDAERCTCGTLGPSDVAGDGGPPADPRGPTGLDGDQDDRTGEGERSPRGGSPVRLPSPSDWQHPTQTSDALADLEASYDRVVAKSRGGP